MQRSPSLPVWGAWIEMSSWALRASVTLSRSPYGERGLKSGPLSIYQNCAGRSPYGERGLKSFVQDGFTGADHVAPRMGSVD